LGTVVRCAETLSLPGATVSDEIGDEPAIHRLCATFLEEDACPP
jgi:hypothetical protein